MLMIRIEHIIPHPLASMRHDEKSIWGKSVVIDLTEKTLLKASSGKGKTTLIAILFGLRKDYSGSVYILDKSARELSVDDWTRLRREVFSIVFQNLQLLPQLTLEENLKIKYALGSDLPFDEVLSWVEFLGLGDKLKQISGTLSLGQQQRLAIIRSLIPKFQFLLMDEPFSHLDRENTEIALELILKRCNHLNAGCLVSTLGDTYDARFDKILYL